MKAIVQDRYGSPDVLQLQEIERPAPADHEVLVRVVAAAVNARDWHMMRGDPYLAHLMSPDLGLGTLGAGDVVLDLVRPACGRG